VVRFGDDAHFRARFLADLVTGSAWQRWYYGAFAPLRDDPVPDAVRRVLAEAGAGSPAVLAALHRLGAAGRVLAVLDRAAHTWLWQAGLDPPEAMLPLVEAALRVADRRGWWVRARPPAADVLRAYLAGRPMPGNWRDRAELTAAVASVLRMLADRGDLRAPGTVEPADPLDGLDWLDEPAVPTEVPGLPVRPTGLLTLRQRRLLDELRRVWRPDLLRPGPLDTPGNALALLAALTAADACWTGDVTAAAMIERLLSAAERRRLGDVAGGDQGPGDGGPETTDGLVADLIEAMAMPGPAALDTPCAGAFLVVRAVGDGRVAALARRGELPDLGLRVLALAMRWAGTDAVCAGRIDVALCRLAGLDRGLPLAELREAWAKAPACNPADILDPLGVTGDPDVLTGGELGLPDADRVIGTIADGLLRHWARWLRGFATATTGYLLTNLVRRPGRLRPDGPDLVIELDPRPLDPVLALAGYLDDWDATPLLGRGQLRFRSPA
jgi:hypothetical protein